jgi:hypothetical protein
MLLQLIRIERWEMEIPFTVEYSFKRQITFRKADESRVCSETSTDSESVSMNKSIVFL